MVNDHEGWSVYFAMSAGKTKVGVAGRKPEVRVAQIAAMSPSPVSLIYAVVVGSRSAAHRAEALIHALLHARHSHNEWFDGEVTQEEAHELCRDVGICASPRRTPPRSSVRPRTPGDRTSRQDPSWTNDQWQRHDERVAKLKEAYASGDFDAQNILAEMSAAKTITEIEAAATWAETWYTSRIAAER